MDMQWLQRDLGLYVVGLFDTFHATNALGYPQHSLASLLKKFVNFAAQKQYQMADWRIRSGDYPRITLQSETDFDVPGRFQTRCLTTLDLILTFCFTSTTI